MRIFAGVLLTLCLAAGLPAARTLDFYFVDVEGGQATLIVTPAGQSMLVDCGWPGFEGRDAKRIQAAAKLAGIKKIDYLLVTHYHTDHVGGVPQFLERMPAGVVIDHGSNTESSKNALALSKAYDEAIARFKHITVKAGDSLPLKGVKTHIVAARGEVIPDPLPGTGADNPLCAAEQRRAEDKGENARSIGFILEYGKFRFIDLADLTWNKELDLVCPKTKLGTIDVYLVTHHGMNMSGPSAIVHSLHPKVAIMNNGAKKGGSPETFQILRKSPGLEDIWQLHYALAGGESNNPPDAFIANTSPDCEGKWLKLSVDKTGSFTIENSRNNYRKTYK